MASSGKVCMSCGDWVDYGVAHNCATTYTTPIKTTEDILKDAMSRRISSGGVIGDSKLPTKDIRWNEYIPARPPESGEYLVVIYDSSTGNKEWRFSEFEKDKLSWKELYSTSEVATHYAKIEMP